MAYENFLGLFSFFLRSLIPKKSSGMQKPYICVTCNPSNKKPTQKFNSSSLWLRAFYLIMGLMKSPKNFEDIAIFEI